MAEEVAAEVVIDMVASDVGAEVVGASLLEGAAGDVAAGAIGDVAAGAVGDAVAGSAADGAATAVGDTVAGSGPAVTSSATSAPAATDTASNAASKLAAVDNPGGAAVTANAATPVADAGTVLEGGVGPSVSGAAAPAAGTTAAKAGVMSFPDWLKSPQAIAAGIQTVGGALGGMGKASLDRSTMERKAELELQNKQAYAKYLRDASTQNTYTGLIGSAPSGNPILNTSAGKPVYNAATGLLNSGRP